MATAQPDGGKLARLKERAKATCERGEKKPSACSKLGCRGRRASIEQTLTGVRPRPRSRITAARVQPSGISKKNRLARNDAALGSETQPTPAGSESGTDEEKLGKENKRSEEKRKAVLSSNGKRRVKKKIKKKKKSLKIAARLRFISQL